MLYLLHGDDELGQEETLSAIRGRLGSPEMVELNTTYLDGAKVSLADIQRVCDVVPFLAKRRLVVVDGLLASLSPKGKAARQGSRKRSTSSQTQGKSRARQARVPSKDLQEYLLSLPKTTVLVLREPKSLSAQHTILRLAAELAREKPARAVIREHRVPRQGQLGAWVQSRAKKRGGQIARDAAEALAAFVGRDLRLLDQEIIKLVTYAGPDEPITIEAVKTLVPDSHAASIFDFVDAVTGRQAKQAISVLHRLLNEGYAPLVLLSMISRQLRTIIQVKELQGQGYAPNRIAQELRLHPYVVEKALRQGRALGYQKLERAYRRLLAADVAIKTGAQDPETTLDLLVLEICGD